MKHFSIHADTAREVRLTLFWISALLIAGAVANLLAAAFD